MWPCTIRNLLSLAGPTRSGCRRPPLPRRRATVRPQLEALEARTVLSGGLVGNLVVFGDSLSDTGNADLATGGALLNPAFYYQGRFSNGPIWVDTLAKYLGEPAVQPSLAGGLDYAFGGATVAYLDQPPPFNAFPRVSQQVGQYLTGHTPAANDLIVVWGGANDFIESFASPTGPINPILSADTLASSLETLADAGARQFVVPNVPPLGETPFIQGLGSPALSAAADQWAAAFDAELAADVGNFQLGHPGATVVAVDVAGLFQQATQPSNPFGFANTTDAVGPLVPGTVFLAAVTATGPQDYLFLDGVHPTSKGHQLIGVKIAAAVYDALGVHHLVVTSTADSVDPTASGLSLRELVNLSNAMNGQQTITFDLGPGPHQINLSGKDLPLTQDLTVRGPGDGRLTVSGEGKSRIFAVAANAHVTLSHLTLAHGAADKGGAVINAGQLRVEASVFLFNTAQLGGALYNTGTLQMQDSVLEFNTAAGGPVNAGGALANSGPSATASLSSLVVFGNAARGGALAQGGGIANLGGAELSIAFSLIAGNSAAGVEAWGGGIFNDAGSTLNLSFSLLTANVAAGNAKAGGHGLGGGLYLARGAKVQMQATLIVGNSASTRGRNVYQAT